MQKMKKIAIGLGMAVGLTAAPAFAQNWYLDIGAGQAKPKELSAEFAWGGSLGYRFTPHIAAEVAYYDLGRYEEHETLFGEPVLIKTKAYSYGAALVGTLPFSPAFEAYAKIGWARSKASTDFSVPLGTFANAKDNENEAYYGVGARWMFSPQWGLFAEWMRHDKFEVDRWLLGAQFRF